MREELQVYTATVSETRVRSFGLEYPLSRISYDPPILAAEEVALASPDSVIRNLNLRRSRLPKDAVLRVSVSAVYRLCDVGHIRSELINQLREAGYEIIGEEE